METDNLNLGLKVKASAYIEYQQLYLRRQAQSTQELTRVQRGSNSLGKNYIRQNSHWHQITCEKFGDSMHKIRAGLPR